MTDSQSLLAEFVHSGSDAAFRGLVTGHLDLVYSTALRLVGGDTHWAEDVAQTVFVDLARKARALPKDVRLGGWLHRDTCFVAANLLRGERRRQARERQAVEMNALQNESEADFSLVAPMLDEAINELGEADRTAILLRFFEQHDFRSVGEALGSNEDAARMRVNRALGKLESLLKRRGVTTSATALSVALLANAVQAAPVGLAVTISTAVTLAGASIAASATATATQAIAMTTLQKTIIGATLAAAVATGIYQARQASRLRDENQTLRQQQAPLTEQIQQLQHERDAATRQLAALREDNERLNRNTPELLKLRAEVTRLRSLQSESATQREVSPSELPEWKPDRLMNAGRFTPQNAAQTFLWAATTTNLTEMADSIVPDTSDPPSDEAIQSFVKNPVRYRISDYLKLKVLSQTNISGDEVQLELYAQSAAGVGVSTAQTLRNVDGQWKFVLFNTRDADGKILYVDVGKKHSPP